MKTAIGYKRIQVGSKLGKKLDKQITKFSEKLGFELKEIFTDFYESSITSKNIPALEDAIQTVLAGKDHILITSTLFNIEESYKCVDYILKTKVPMLSTSDVGMDIVSVRGIVKRARAMVIHKREMHAQRIKRGHEYARRQGKKFGSKKILEAVKLASEANSNSGDAFRRKIMPYINEILEEETPPVTLAMIKRGLEKRKIVTRTGSLTWHVTTIRNYLKKEREDANDS